MPDCSDFLWNCLHEILYCLIQIINGIPCLVPKDGKILEDQIKLTGNDDSSGADRGI